MTENAGFYRWESQAELVTAQPEDAAIYYEWLLRLNAGSRPGDALRSIGVAGVRAAEEGQAGWVPVFFVDDPRGAVERLKPGTWRVEERDIDGDSRLYVYDEQGLVIRLDERNGAGSGQVSFDCSALDVVAAARFYSSLLGLDVLEVVDDTYSMRLLSDGHGVVAGVFQLHGVGRLNRRPVWITYFEVDSVEEAVTRAVQSGSRVRIPPVDSPFNRYAVLDDPWGNLYGFSAVFSGDRFADVPVDSSASPDRGSYADFVDRPLSTRP